MVIKDMWLRITRGHHPNLVGIAINKKTKILNAYEDVEEKKSLYNIDENVNFFKHCD